MSAGILIVVRHGETTYNAGDVWTGITDVDLTAAGRADAREMGRLLRDVRLDCVYVSCLKRTAQTRDGLLDAHGGASPICKKTAALNERDYGDYTGLDKQAVRARFGPERFLDIRRSFDAVIPNGESLRDVAERVVPWYLANVVPLVLGGANVLIVGHGNSDRALRKFLEDVSDEGVANFEMDFEKIYLYDVGEDGRAIGEPEIRTIVTR